MNIRKGDTVYVRTGEFKGKTGRVLFVLKDKDRVVVEGINLRKRHQRPSQKNQQGGIVTVEQPIHVSNVGIYSSSLGGPTKIAYKEVKGDGKRSRIRVCAKTGEEI